MTALFSSISYILAAVVIAVCVLLAKDDIIAIARAAFEHVKRPRATLRLTLAGIALVFLLPMAAFAANTVTYGQLTFTYFDSGVTEIKATAAANAPGQQVIYAVLTSAQTSQLRGIYGDVKTASGGSSATEPLDNTPTLPSTAPHLGDLTD